MIAHVTPIKLIRRTLTPFMCGVYKTIAQTHLDLITNLITNPSELSAHAWESSKRLFLLGQVPLAVIVQTDLFGINLV